MATNRDFKVKNGLTVSGDIQQDNAQYLKGKLANGTATRTFGINGANDVYIGSIDTATGGDMLFTNGGEKARITAGGNLGIGTTLPAYRAHISAASPAGLGVFRDFDVAGGAAGAYIDIGAKSGSSFVAGAQFQGILNSATTGSLTLSTLNTTMQERMRIGVTGNVAIGSTATGVGRLTVATPTFPGAESAIALQRWSTSYNGGANGYSVMLKTNGNFGNVLNSDWGSRLSFGVLSNGGIDDTTFVEHLTIINGGNVGIGNTAPSAKLHVSGDAILNALKIHATDAISRTAAGAIYLGYENATNLIFSTTATSGGGTERMRVDSTGGVRINRSTALAGAGEKLTVQANDTGFTMFTQQQNASGYNLGIQGQQSILFYAAAGSNVGGISNDGTSLQHAANNNMVFVVNGAERMRINSAGVITDSASRELGLKDVPISSNAWVRGLCNVVTANTSINVAATAGEVYSIFNDSAATIVLAAGAGLTMRLGGTTATGNRSILPYGYATIWFRATNVCVVNGNVT